MWGRQATSAAGSSGPVVLLGGSVVRARRQPPRCGDLRDVPDHGTDAQCHARQGRKAAGLSWAAVHRERSRERLAAPGGSGPAPRPVQLRSEATGDPLFGGAFRPRLPHRPRPPGSLLRHHSRGAESSSEPPATISDALSTWRRIDVTSTPWCSGAYGPSRRAAFSSCRSQPTLFPRRAWYQATATWTSPW